MKIIISPDSFKGSCSAIEVAKSIEETILSLDNTVDLVTIPVADGGEGTIDAITACVESTIYEVEVSNSLTGENGASYVYGPQKGATPEMVQEQDVALAHFAGISAKELGQDFAVCPGAGAVGGLGFVLMAFCKAKFASGIDIVLDVCGFEKELADASLVITGEGRIDGQSINGKVLYGIGTRAKEYNVPVIAFGGSVMPESENLMECGITAMFSIANGPITLEYAIGHTQELLKQSVKNMMRVFLRK